MPVCTGMFKTATSPEKHPVLLIEFEVLYPLHLGNINASGFCIFFGIRVVFRHDIASIRQRFSLWMHSGDFLCIGSDTQQGRKHWKQLFWTGGFESILGTLVVVILLLGMFCLLKSPTHIFWVVHCRTVLLCLVQLSKHTLLHRRDLAIVNPNFIVWSPKNSMKAAELCRASLAAWWWDQRSYSWGLGNLGKGLEEPHFVDIGTLAFNPSMIIHNNTAIHTGIPEVFSGNPAHHASDGQLIWVALDLAHFIVLHSIVHTVRCTYRLRVVFVVQIHKGHGTWTRRSFCSGFRMQRVCLRISSWPSVSGVLDRSGCWLLFPQRYLMVLPWSFGYFRFLQGMRFCDLTREWWMIRLYYC